jgi:hypothetical protein
VICFFFVIYCTYVYNKKIKMNKIFLVPLLILFLIILFSSCQESENIYSCDPTINEFVRENRIALSQLCVTELVTYNIAFQRAIFISWDYKKKREAWIEKLCYILNHEPFTTSEKNHIQKLIDHIGEDYFLDEKINNITEIRSKFAKEWIKYATYELGFSEKYIAFIVFRLYTAPDQLEAELSALKSLRSKPIADSEPGDCGCNQSADFCGPLICYGRDCSITTFGCGWLFSMPCDGQCY